MTVFIVFEGLVSTAPPMAIVYSSEYVKIRTMSKEGIVADLLRLGVLILLSPLIICVSY